MVACAFQALFFDLGTSRTRRCRSLPPSAPASEPPEPSPGLECIAYYCQKASRTQPKLGLPGLGVPYSRTNPAQAWNARLGKPSTPGLENRPIQPWRASFESGMVLGLVWSGFGLWSGSGRAPSALQGCCNKASFMNAIATGRVIAHKAARQAFEARGSRAWSEQPACVLIPCMGSKISGSFQKHPTKPG